MVVLAVEVEREERGCRERECLPKNGLQKGGKFGGKEDTTNGKEGGRKKRRR